MSELSQFFSSLPAGSKFPAPWSMADNITTRACNGQKVSSSQVSAAVYAGLSFSVTRQASGNATITLGNFPYAQKGNGYYLLFGNSTTGCKYGTDAISWSTATLNNATLYSSGYDAANALHIIANAGASGNCIDTSPTGSTWTARSNGGASGTPAGSSPKAMAISLGGVTLIPISGGTNISRATNGTTYTYQTAPFTISGATVIARLESSGLFVLYDYTVSTTTYYTSATGLTGSWTSRTLPFAPENAYMSQFTRGAGKLWVMSPNTAALFPCTLAYTTDLINWTTVEQPYPVVEINPFTHASLFSPYPYPKQQANDIGEPYLRVKIDHPNAVTGQTGYYTADGIVLFSDPLATGSFDCFPGIFLDATTGLMATATNGNWYKFTLDASTKSLPLHESHIMKVY